MANQMATELLALGLHPVLLGRQGDGLKRPLHKQWQTAACDAADAAGWPAGHNVGIRCGRQPSGRCLLVFDFDAEAERVFPTWRAAAEQIIGQTPVVVSSGRGYHLYLYTPVEMGSRTLAARRVAQNGRSRLLKFIETIGRQKQVVAAGGRHPNGRYYRFISGGGYADIPAVSVKQLADLTALARSYDERPSPSAALTRKPACQKPAGLRSCLDYARRFLGAAEQVEPNGDIRFLGHGGLLVTADGRGWYAFSDDTGGGLAELIAWHRRQMPAGEEV